MGLLLRLADSRGIRFFGGYVWCKVTVGGWWVFRRVTDGIVLVLLLFGKKKHVHQIGQAMQRMRVFLEARPANADVPWCSLGSRPGNCAYPSFFKELGQHMLSILFPSKKVQGSPGLDADASLDVESSWWHSPACWGLSRGILPLNLLDRRMLEELGPGFVNRNTYSSNVFGPWIRRWGIRPMLAVSMLLPCLNWTPLQIHENPNKTKGEREAALEHQWEALQKSGGTTNTWHLRGGGGASQMGSHECETCHAPELVESEISRGVWVLFVMFSNIVSKFNAHIFI